MLVGFATFVGRMRKAVVYFLVGLLLVGSIAGALLAPQPAHAQFITSDIPQAATWVWEKVKVAAEWAYGHGAAIAYKNAIKTFSTRIAYDTAVWLGSGGKGQQPLFVTKGWGAYLKDVEDDAAGDFLDTLFSSDAGGIGGDEAQFAKDFALGINVCRPGSIQATLVIKGFLLNEIQPRKPRCTLSTITQNWEQALRTPNALGKFGVVFDSSQSDLGVALTTQNTLATGLNKAGNTAQTKLLSDEGVKDVTEFITDNIKTPAVKVKDAVLEPLRSSSNEFISYTGDALADALNVFTNTLGSRLLKRLKEGDVPSPSRRASQNFGGGLGFQAGGIEYAVQANSILATPQLLTSDNLDPISELSNCPDDVRYAPPNNCTITLKFAQALRKAQEGDPLTVQEAMDQNFIDGKLRFSLRRTSADSHAPTQAWYLSDLKKLRLARVLPVGWEFAAQAFADQNITLRDVIGSKPDYRDGFNERDPLGGCNTSETAPVGYDPNRDGPGKPGPWHKAGPYCGLIDPNWVLKAPAEQCRITAYGEQLQPESSQRQQTCVDVQHCVAEREDGSCQAWGYCKQEKAIWRFGGDSCEYPAGSGTSAWATCESFVSSDGRQATYLKNSLAGYDDGTCTDAAGCRWYSTAFNQSEGWCKVTPTRSCREDSDCGGGDVCLLGVDKRYRVTGTQAQVNTVDFSVAPATTLPRLYLKQLSRYSCDARVEGCRAFLRLSNVDDSSFNLNRNSTTYNYNHEVVKRVVAAVTPPPPNTKTYDQYASVQPVTLKEAPPYLGCYTEANEVHDVTKDPSECKQYLAWCNASEVGCERYTPADGNPAVPALVKEADRCPAECVGLNTYKQENAFFEHPAAPATKNFIPASAKQCSASAAGCEEFTNVQQNERKEYYTEIRQCVRPDDSTVSTYYTWTGSDLTGYQLKVWKLSKATLPAVGPAVTEASGICDAEFPQNPDCKQFYGDDGITVYYRLESRIIYASDTCNRYRATNIKEPDCSRTHGRMETVGGVTSCFYQAIPKQGKQCSATELSCREYRGPTASNMRYVFPVSTFGDAEYGVQGDQSATGGWTGGSNSTESVSALGHSLSTGGGVSKDISGSLTSGKQYLVSLWYKGGDVAVSMITPGGPVSLGIPAPAPPAGEWATYTFGPSPVITAAQAGPGTSLLNILSGGRFVDNIAFREIQDTFFVKKNSWVTPQSCNSSQLFCKAYRDRAGRLVPLKSFSKICRAEAVGCEALVDTRNTDSPHQQSITAGDQQVEVEADQVVARVYDQQKACAASAAACTRVGKPTFTSTGLIKDWSDTFVRLDPDSFKDFATGPLCASAQDMCQEYKDPTGGLHTFKDPAGRTCEFRQLDVRIGFAWYKKGTDEPCNLVTNPSFEQFGVDTSLPENNPPPMVRYLSGKVDDATRDSFPGWSADFAHNNPGAGVFATSSVNGRYWGSALAKLSGTALTTTVNIGEAQANQRLFAVYANIYVPEGGTLQAWRLDTTGATKLGGAAFTQDVFDTAVGQEQWDMLWAVVSVPANATSFDLKVVGFVTGTVYVDQVQAVELDKALSNDEALSLAAVPYAYNCPSTEAGCTAFRDPELTKATYYYLNNQKLDKASCSGKVSERGGCLLFNDLSQSQVPWSSTATYQLSREQNDKSVAPVGTTGSTSGLCENIPARTCNADSQCDDICQVGNTGHDVCSNDTKHTCSSARDCVDNPPRCVANAGICENDRSRICSSNADCGQQQSQAKPQFSIALPKCYATQTSCFAAGNGNVCHYCEIDATCGGASAPTPYLCNNPPPTPGNCILDPVVNRCVSDPERICSDDFSCVVNPPTCGPAQARTCANSSRSCITNADCGGQCRGASVSTLDTNLILKVRRDRTCSEWLSCQSESPRLNQQTGRFDNVCYGLGRCDQAGTTDVQGLSSCGHWLPLPSNPQPLTITQYQARITGIKDTGWRGSDLSGYTIPDLYPIEALREKNYSADPLKPDYRLTYLNIKNKTCGGRINGNPCATIGETCSDGSKCGYEDMGTTGNGALDAEGKLTGAIGKTCRAYPEADAPFSDAVVEDWKAACDGATDLPAPGCAAGSPAFIELASKKAPGFKDAYTCQKGEDCLCSYTRASYSQGDSLFYALNGDAQPRYAVAEGEDSTNSSLKKTNPAIGLHGYCLEKDPSRVVSAGDAQDNACLTWVPLDVVGGEASAYDYAAQAGYQGGTTYYCSEAAGKYDVSATNNQRYFELLPNPGTIEIDLMASCDPNLPNCYFNRYWPAKNSDYPADTLPLRAIQSIIFINNAANPQQFINWPAVGAFGGNILTGVVWDPRRPTVNSWQVYQAFETAERRTYVWDNNGGSNENKVTIYITVDKLSGSVLAIWMNQLDRTPDEAEYSTSAPYIKYWETCNQVVKVAQGTQNKAWTGRLASTTYQVDPAAKLGFTSALARQPYGRLNSAPTNEPVLVGAQAASAVNIPAIAQSPGLYSAFSAQSLAAPYAGTSQSSTRRLGGGMCIGGDRNETACTQNRDCGTGGFCMGYINGTKTIQNEARHVTGFSRILNQLFARVYKVLRWETPFDAALNSFADKWHDLDTNPCEGVPSSECPLGQPSADVSGSTPYSILYTNGWGTGKLVDPPTGSTKVAGVPAAPVVRRVAFGPDKRAAGEIPRPTAEGAGASSGFTIITADGLAHQGDEPVVMKADNPFVNVAFYAYNPNGEQMPLRAVLVDWGDGTTAGADNGSYKNHKHICQPKEICTSTGCNPNPDYTFGDSSSACVSDGNGIGYFKFSHVYSCDDPIQCVYHPKVYVRDNWGWCTGQGGAAHWGIAGDSRTECRPEADNTQAWYEFGSPVQDVKVIQTP